MLNCFFSLGLYLTENKTYLNNGKRLRRLAACQHVPRREHSKNINNGKWRCKVVATLPLSPDTYIERTQKRWQPWRQNVTHSITHASSIMYIRITFFHTTILTLFGTAQLITIMKLKEKFEALICTS
jgi:hypothetical protein